MKERWFIFLPPLLAVLIYFVTIQNGFVFDDGIVVAKDPRMGTFDSFFQVSKGELVVRFWSLLIDSVIFNMEPGGFHITNIILHAAVGLVLFLFLRTLLQQFNMKRPALGALVGSILFVAHPMGTEAVAAVSHRKEMLAGVYLLLALWRAIVPGRGWLRSLEISLYLALALFSKAPSIIFFPLIITVDFLQRRWDWKFYIAPLATAGLYIYTRFFGIAKAVGGERHFEAFNPQMIDASEGERFLTSFKTLGMYWWLGVWPWQPTMERHVEAAHRTSWEPWVVLVLVLVGTAAAWLVRKRHPMLALGLTWLIVSPIPTINLLPLNFLFSERYMYLPLLGLGVVAAWAVARGTKPWVPGVLLALSVLVFSPIVVQRNLEWKTSSTLLAATIKDNPDSPRLNRFYSIDLNRQGRYEEALIAAEKAVQGQPKSPTNWAIYAQALSVNRRLDEALEAWRKAVSISSNPRPIWLSNLGVALTLKGDIDEAQKYLADAVRRDPLDPRVRLRYVQGLMMKPETQLEGIDYLERTLRIEPQNQDLWALLAEVHLARKDSAKAVDAADRGYNSGARTPVNLYLQGIKLEAQGDAENAARIYRSMVGHPQVGTQLQEKMNLALKRVDPQWRGRP